MGSYQIVRGSEKQGGYVSMVEKGRVNGEVRTLRHICGLGTMTMQEFKTFRAWAVSLKPQEYRKDMVLACDIAVVTKEESTKKIAEHAQKKTTVKAVPKEKTTKKLKSVRKHFPVKPLEGYRGKTHTEIMRERETERKAIEKSKGLYKRKYVDITPTQREKYIKELEGEREKQIVIRDEWDIKSKGGGMYFGKSERARMARAQGEIKRIDGHLKELKRSE